MRRNSSATGSGGKAAPVRKRRASPRSRRPSDRKKAVAPPPGDRARDDAPEDAVVEMILRALAEAPTLSPRDIAERLAEARRRPGDRPQLWRRYFTAVKQRALSLARQGRIEIVRKGEVVDPEDFRGIVRYRLKRGGGAQPPG